MHYGLSTAPEVMVRNLENLEKHGRLYLNELFCIKAIGRFSKKIPDRPLLKS